MNKKINEMKHCFLWRTLPPETPSMSDCILPHRPFMSTPAVLSFLLCFNVLNPLDVFGLEFYESSYCLSCHISL